MLKGINPLLYGQLLLALDEMGHGDALVIADSNFPAHRLGRRTLELPGADVPAVVDAVLSVFPIEGLTPPVFMDDPVTGNAVQSHVAAATRALGVAPRTVERFTFYELAAEAWATVRTGEQRTYGNVILYKGVVGGHDADQ